MDNNTPALNRTSLMQALLFIVMIIIISGSMAVYVLSDPGVKDAITLTRVAWLIRDIYPESLNQNKTIEQARDAILESLDKYSGYMKQSNFNRMDEEMSGGYFGIGISIVKDDHGLLVMSVRENSPAAESGMMAGDVIYMVDSILLKDMAIDKAARQLRGKENSKVKITIFRAVSDDTLKLEIIRKRIPLMHIPFAGFTPDSLIYIKLLNFDAGSSDEVKDALDSLLNNKKSVTAIGVVLDLRGNPGGLFSEAYKVADIFLDDGQPIVGTNGRSRWNSKRYYSTGTDATGGLPLAILVDRSSASSSEIVAGALRYLDRAVLIGDTTYGKGLVQGFVRYPEGDGLRLTISRYYFGDGVYINEFDSTLNEIGEGLPPDYFYKLPRNIAYLSQLEKSLLLNQFAFLYQDDIIKAAENGSFDLDWLSNVNAYLHENDFNFKSDRTRISKLLDEIAIDEKSSKRLKKSVIDFYRQSKKVDNNEILYHKEYILSRLKQLAYERKYGIYLTYKKVFVNEKPILKFVSEILQKDVS